MRMIDRIKIAMRDSGACDWLKSEELEIAATAAVEAMRGQRPSQIIVDRFDDDNSHMSTYHCISQSWDMMLNSALNE